MSERRTLQELIGVAVNSTSLRIEARAPGGETSLLRVAALGAAVLHVQHGADRAGVQGKGAPLAEVVNAPRHEPKPADQVAGELAGVLYHVRYGGQHELLAQAIALFAADLAMRRRFGPEGVLSCLAPEDRQPLLHRFSERAIHEWLSDRCIACGGSGKLERTESGSWIRPRGMMKRNAVFRTCTVCHGSRRAVPSHSERRKHMQVTIEQYDVQGWPQSFNAAQTWLTVHITRRIRRPLAVQLERTRPESAPRLTPLEERSKTRF